MHVYSSILHNIAKLEKTKKMLKYPSILKNSYNVIYLYDRMLFGNN